MNKLWLVQLFSTNISLKCVVYSKISRFSKYFH